MTGPTVLNRLQIFMLQMPKLWFESWPHSLKAKTLLQHTRLQLLFIFPLNYQIGD